MSHRILGADLGRRLVVVELPRLDDSAPPPLWVHSPVEVAPALRAEFDTLGTIRHVVAPSRWHDECLGEFQEAYPQALFHGTPGLAAARRDLRFNAELTDTPHPDWNPVLHQHLVKGMPGMNEVVFLHRPSRSLILADLAMNLGPHGSAWTRLLFTLAGAWGRFGPTRFARFLIKDRPAVRRSIETILTWDFDRILVGHGRVIESGGKPALREAFAFLNR